MNNEILQQTYNFYLDAFSDIAADKRERLLRQSVTDDVVFTNPKGGGQGFVSLLEHVEQFQRQSPGASFRSNKLLAHHGQFLSEWTMYKKDGSEFATAHTYGRFNEQGLLTYLIGFF